jgi:hypothetical protein
MQSRTSDARRVDTFRPRRRSASCWKGCAARRASPNSVAARHRLVDVLFLEAGKRRLAGDPGRAATSDEVKDLRREAQALKEVVADLTLENRLLKKRMASPVCKGFDRECRMISLLQRIRPRRVPPGQDGDTRAPVLIKPSASSAAFLTRLPERPSTVRPSR